MELSPVVREDAILWFPSPVCSVGISFPLDEVLEFSSRKFRVHYFFNNVFFAVIGDDWGWGVWEFLGWEFCGDEGREVFFVKGGINLFPGDGEFEAV